MNINVQEVLLSCHDVSLTCDHVVVGYTLTMETLCGMHLAVPAHVICNVIMLCHDFMSLCYVMMLCHDAMS